MDDKTVAVRKSSSKALQSRQTGSRGNSPKALQSRQTGNRGTGQIMYHFELPVTASLRDKVQDTIEFHLEVFAALFGPRVFQTPFIRRKKYMPPKFSYDNFTGYLKRSTFKYALNKKIIDGIGLLPRVKPFSITQDRQVIADIGGYAGPISINADLGAVREDVADVFRTALGVDVADLDFWNKMDSYHRSQAVQEFEQIVTLLEDLDDEAVVSLLDVLKKRPARRQVHARQLTLWDIQQFRQQLEKLQQQTEKRARDAQLLEYEMQSRATTLAGSHLLYFKEREYERLYSKEWNAQSVNMNIVGDPRFGDQVSFEPSPRLQKLKAEIEALREKMNFGPHTLQNLENRFLKDFEKRAAVFARSRLNKHLRLLEYYGERTDIRGMARDIKDLRASFFLDLFNPQTYASLDKIKSTLNSSKKKFAELEKRYPLISYINFWTLYEDAKVSENIFNRRSRISFSEGQFRLLIDRTRKSIKSQLKELKKPSYVWKGEIIITGALKAFDMYADPAIPSHDGMLTDMAMRKVASERSSGVIKGIVLTVIALALSLTGVGVLVGAGIVLSIVDVYLMIEDRAEISSRKQAGLSLQDPPSDFWILLAVAGVGADVSGFIKMVSVGKSGKIVESTQEMRILLHRIEKVSKKARAIVEAGRTIKIELEMAVTKLAARISETATLSQAANEILEVAYHLGRLGFTKFRHFVLELSRRGLLRKYGGINKTDSFDDILAKLDQDSLDLLKKLHLEALGKGKSAVQRLEEIESLLQEYEKRYLAWKEKARKLWDRRRKGSKTDPNADYLRLLDEHKQAMKKRDELKTVVDSLKVERKTLNPSRKMSPREWGEALETHTMNTVLGKDRKPIWQRMESKTTKSVDSVRRAEDGIIEAMQHKGIIFPSDSNIESKIAAKIRESKLNINSDKYTRFVKQFNGDTIPMGKSEFGFEIPENWEDLRIVLEIKIVSNTPVDIDSILHSAYAVFYSEFPENAKLYIRQVRPNDVLKDLEKVTERVTREGDSTSTFRVGEK